MKDFYCLRLCFPFAIPAFFLLYIFIIFLCFPLPFGLDMKLFCMSRTIKTQTSSKFGAKTFLRLHTAKATTFPIKPTDNPRARAICVQIRGFSRDNTALGRSVLGKTFMFYEWKLYVGGKKIKFCLYSLKKYKSNLKYI